MSILYENAYTILCSCRLISNWYNACTLNPYSVQYTLFENSTYDLKKRHYNVLIWLTSAMCCFVELTRNLRNQTMAADLATVGLSWLLTFTVLLYTSTLFSQTRYLYFSGNNPMPNDYSIVFGMHVTTTAGSRLVVQASSITKHNRYNSNTMSNDIAIIGRYNTHILTWP